MNNDNNQESKSDKSAPTSHKYVFYRKPSIKKKAPEIKQTKTSMQRMLKANPLLEYQHKNIDIPCALKLSSESTNELVKSKESLINSKESSTNSHKNPSNDKKLTTTGIFRNPLGSVISGNSTNFQVNRKLAKSRNKSPIKFNRRSPTIVSSTRYEAYDQPTIASNSKSNITKTQINSSKNKPKEVKNKKAAAPRNNEPIRRSLSAQYFDRKKGLLRTDSEKSLNKIKHSQSLPKINKEESDTQCTMMTPVQEISCETSLIFKTPSAYERRSIISTPLSEAGLRRSLYRPSTPLPSLHELQKRLNDWLMKRGKSISLFHHLKSFDIPRDVIDEEDKENVETNQDFEHGSFEDLQIIQKQNEGTKENLTVITSDNVEQVAKSALEDLLNLIQDGYPLNQCESWLHLIKDQYTQLQEEPEYWECRAAIEEARGNISKAVECYKTAIIQGAEVQEVDKSLDVLLQKFSLLNLNAEIAGHHKISKERERIIKDARNVFKSSIIKFAVQEKKLKKNKSDVTLVATPVRRSARLSRSGYVSTPGVTIYSTLKELKSPSINFKSNKALN